MASASAAIKGLLLHKQTHTHLTVKEQPLLHTCRERVSHLSFVFESELLVSIVTTHPSSYPCIDIATDLISDGFKGNEETFLEMCLRPLKPHGLLLEGPEKWILGVADKLCTIDFYHNFNFIF